MTKNNKLIKISFLLIMFLFILFIVLSLLIVKEGKETNQIIEEFKNRSEYVGTYLTNQNETISYYKVKASYDYEKNGLRNYSNSYTSDETLLFTDLQIGTTGDIYISSANPTVLSYIGWISKKIKIGHCALICDDEAKQMVEIVGNKNKENNKVVIKDNNWLEETNAETIILRNKDNINKIKLDNVINDKLNKKYNYFFFIKNKEKYYCFDLVSRIIEETKNEQITSRDVLISGSQLIMSEELYMIYYKEKSNKNGIDYNVYYLEEENIDE